jgi:DNA-binding GntR family transcriptional regulator
MQTTRNRIAYEGLRARMGSGLLRPGTRLGEVAIARSLSVSRGPVREAIRQLVSDGLVVERPGAGAFVRCPDADDVREIYGLRTALEAFAAAEACTHITRGGIVALRDACEGMESVIIDAESGGKWTDRHRSAMLRSDMRFHETIATHCGNRAVAKLLEDQRLLQHLLAYRPGRASPSTPVTRREALAEHRAILAAIDRHDAVAAGSAMSAHIGSALANALRATVSPTAGLPGGHHG